MTPAQPVAPIPVPGEKAVVVGGGIVGVCCALYLQREGYAVTLIDPAAAGDSTAKWSCGQMAVSEVIPLSKPGILKKIPGWLLDQKGPLALQPRRIAWHLAVVPAVSGLCPALENCRNFRRHGDSHAPCLRGLCALAGGMPGQDPDGRTADHRGVRYAVGHRTRT